MTDEGWAHSEFGRLGSVREWLVSRIADAIGGDVDKSNAVVDALDAYLQAPPADREAALLYLGPNLLNVAAEPDGEAEAGARHFKRILDDFDDDVRKIICEADKRRKQGMS